MSIEHGPGILMRRPHRRVGAVSILAAAAGALALGATAIAVVAIGRIAIGQIVAKKVRTSTLIEVDELWVSASGCPKTGLQGSSSSAAPR